MGCGGKSGCGQTRGRAGGRRRAGGWRVAPGRAVFVEGVDGRFPTCSFSVLPRPPPHPQALNSGQTSNVFISLEALAASIEAAHRGWGLVRFPGVGVEGRGGPELPHLSSFMTFPTLGGRCVQPPPSPPPPVPLPPAASEGLTRKAQRR